MTRARTLPLAATVLTLAACSSQGGAQNPPPELPILDASSCQDPTYADINAEFCYGGDYVNPMTIPLETKAGETVLTPSGMEVTLTAVEIGTVDPSEWSMGFPHASDTHDRAVYVTVQYHNPGAEPIQFADSTGTGPVTGTLYYGADMYPAEPWPTDWLDDSRVDNDMPRQLSPGSTAEDVELFSFPADGGDELSYELRSPLDSMVITVFSDVEDL